MSSLQCAVSLSPMTALLGCTLWPKYNLSRNSIDAYAVHFIIYFMNGKNRVAKIDWTFSNENNGAQNVVQMKNAYITAVCRKKAETKTKRHQWMEFGYLFLRFTDKHKAGVGIIVQCTQKETEKNRKKAIAWTLDLNHLLFRYLSLDSVDARATASIAIRCDSCYFALYRIFQIIFPNIFCSVWFRCLPTNKIYILYVVCTMYIQHTTCSAPSWKMFTLNRG